MVLRVVEKVKGPYPHAVEYMLSIPPWLGVNGIEAVLDACSQANQDCEGCDFQSICERLYHGILEYEPPRRR